jgi:hypothetical protein
MVRLRTCIAGPPNGVSSMGFGSEWEEPQRCVGSAQDLRGKRIGEAIIGHALPMARI